MTRLFDTVRRFLDDLPERSCLYLGGGTGEPSCISGVFNQEPELAKGVTFKGIWIPGINTIDWAGHHQEARSEAIFISPSLRKSFEIGDTAFLPISYSQSTKWLSRTLMHGAVIMVSPPDSEGMVNLGVSVDFAPTIIKRSNIPCLAIINPALRRVKDGVSVPLSRFSHYVEYESDLPQFPIKSLPITFKAIGENIASLIEDGNTLQFGLGNVQQSALLSLKNHRNLRVHSGMISDPLLDLLNSGAIADSNNAITTGMAVGTNVLYDTICEHESVRFRPVTYTHSSKVLSQIKYFKSINSALQVDLLGQVNAETIDGRQISGIGGLTDFHKGATASDNGQGIIALSSTTSNHKISRILPVLSESSVSISRSEADTIVTEYGIANLKDKSIDERAEALIRIAHPKYREGLAKSWIEMRQSL